MRAFLTAALFALLACSLRAAEPESSSAANFKTENVVIVVLDGIRYSESWGDAAHTHMPNLREKLAPAGVVFTDFRNKGQTLTNPGHAAIATGCYQAAMDNRGAALPAEPSLLQVWLKSSGRETGKAWVIAAKDKLEVLSDCSAAEWAGKFRPSHDCGLKGLGSGYRSDAETMARIKAVLQQHQPRLLLINFKDPDEAGHRGNWTRYLQAVTAADRYASELWELLQRDTHYAGKTALFITNDHGRHADGVASGFRDHGCRCEGCEHILLVALGPDFVPGKTAGAPAQQTDIAPTAAHLLGCMLPRTDGRVLTELFAGGVRSGQAAAETSKGAPAAVPESRTAVPAGAGK